MAFRVRGLQLPKDLGFLEGAQMAAIYKGIPQSNEGKTHFDLGRARRFLKLEQYLGLVTQASLDQSWRIGK